MSTLADVKALLVPGVVADVTNHYITRPDHPCFGTRRRTILAANSASFTLSNEGGPQPSRIPWPKAADASIDGAGRVHLAGHPKPGDPFLTLVLVAK